MARAMVKKKKKKKFEPVKQKKVPSGGSGF